jgi:putative membrane protein
MRRWLSAVLLTAISTAGAFGVAAGTAVAASGPSSQDVTWMQSNAQTDLTEIAAGTLAQSRSTNPTISNLASVTKSQHEASLGQLKALATSTGVTLPTAPNPSQQAQAAQLQTLSGLAFDLAYDNAQIAGHLLSIQQTKVEIADGSDAAVISFAKAYLPVAEMHLSMAEAAHVKLTGMATTVGAGSGGMAAIHSASDSAWLAMVTAGVALVLLSVWLGLRRRPVRH